ncbi:MAG: hypothetical protein KatS3mg129_0515 [Leptospiraceae bacterium]|nr:MAG: hypothetical protein KatS3mg129_0515 [Leptospiraceae bacterium]
MKKIDPYVVAPIHLSKVPGLDLYPNHPELVSIYFPFTQLIAIIGILLGNILISIFSIPLYEISFRFVFLSLEFILIYFILKRDPKYILFFLSPIFLIESLSLHTDIHGILIFILFIKVKSLRIKSLLLPHQIFIKPEGTILFINMIIKYFNKLKQKKLFYLFICYNFIIIIIYFIILKILYNLQYISLETLKGLLLEAKIFNSLFVAYQPFIIMIQNFIYPDSYYAIYYYRKNYVIFLLLINVIIGGYNIYKNHKKNQNYFRKEFWLDIILYQFFLYFIVRASWQPWYFLWLIPLLWEKRKLRWIHFLTSILILWYIPVIHLRVYQSYNYKLFFISLGIWILIYIFFYRKFEILSKNN